MVVFWVFGRRVAPIEIIEGLTVESAYIGKVAFHLI